MMISQTKTNAQQIDFDTCATVLIVDSDSTQVESLCRGMFLFGHECVKKKNISEAIDFLNQPDGDCVDLLLTDITIPGSEGFKLIGHVRALHPNLPIIAVSGFNSSIECELCERDGVVVIKRPFDPNRLDDAIRDLVA